MSPFLEKLRIDRWPEDDARAAFRRSRFGDATEWNDRLLFRINVLMAEPSLATALHELDKSPHPDQLIHVDTFPSWIEHIMPPMDPALVS